jgi:phenylpyruvate tautomerase PptA (4-oxalocrotonate tautomerase family)
MPIVRIDITGPKSPEYRRALLDGARAAVTGALGVADERVTVRVIETPDECVDVPDCRSDRYTIVEVIMYAGRSEEKKKALVAALRDRFAADPGIEPFEIAVVLRDPSTTDLDVLPGAEG